MKQGAIDLLNSERGTLCVLLVLASTVLVLTGFLTPEQWLTYTQWICVTLVASKTVTGAIETLRSSSSVPEARVVAEPPSSP